MATTPTDREPDAYDVMLANGEDPAAVRARLEIDCERWESLWEHFALRVDEYQAHVLAEAKAGRPAAAHAVVESSLIDTTLSASRTARALRRRLAAFAPR